MLTKNHLLRNVAAACSLLLLLTFAVVAALGTLTRRGTPPLSGALPSPQHRITGQSRHRPRPTALTHTHELRPDKHHTSTTNTSTHPELVEKFFSPGHGRAVCRIHHACVRFAEGSVHVRLPRWLAAAPHHLHGCVMVESVPATAPEPSHLVMSDKDLVVAMTVSGRDYHFPHWLVKSGALMDVVDTLFGGAQPRYEPACHTGCDGERLRRDPMARVRAEIDPAVVAFPDVEEGIDMGAWTNEFLSRLFRVNGRDPTIYPLDLRKKGMVMEGCFRSVILPAAKLNNGAQRSLENHVLFKQNGWEKQRRPDLCDKESAVEVVVLDRDESRFFGDLNSVNKVVTDSLGSKGRTVNIRRLTFDDAEFDQQVEDMQSADVVVAAHGAAVTNAIFLQKDSLVIEVFPFGYVYFGFQEAGNKWFNVHCQWLVSKPDRETFEYYLDLLDIDRFVGNKVSKRQVMAAYDRIEAKFSRELPRSKLRYLDADVRFLNKEAVGRQPIKHQNLYPDLRDLGLRIKDWHDRVCRE